MNLPEISLAHVRFNDETWDFGSQAGRCAEVVLGDESVLRCPVAYANCVQVRPPRFETRDVVFEVRDRPNDPDCAPRYVTQQVEVVVDPGETRPLTATELEAKKAEAKTRLIDWLRHVALAGKLLTEPNQFGQFANRQEPSRFVVPDRAKALLPAFCATRHISRLASLGPGYNTSLHDGQIVRRGTDTLLVLVEFEPDAIVSLLDMAQLDIDLPELLHVTVDVRTEQDLDRYRRDDLMSHAVDIWNASSGVPSSEPDATGT